MGGAESEAIVIQPSGAGNGQVIVTNSADGDFTINDDDGAVTDTDTLVLRGTNPDTPGLLGDNTMVIDFSAVGDTDNLKNTVSNSIGGLLYQVRDVTGTKRISFELLDWVEPAARSLLPARSAGGGSRNTFKPWLTRQSPISPQTSMRASEWGRNRFRLWIFAVECVECRTGSAILSPGTVPAAHGGVNRGENV
jgi:hypothetical protein